MDVVVWPTFKHAITVVLILCRCLREQNVPKRTWLLFHDSDCQAEWVGIWDDAPAPPIDEL